MRSTGGPFLSVPLHLLVAAGVRARPWRLLLGGTEATFGERVLPRLWRSIPRRRYSSCGVFLGDNLPRHVLGWYLFSIFHFCMPCYIPEVCYLLWVMFGPLLGNESIVCLVFLVIVGRGGAILVKFSS